MKSFLHMLLLGLVLALGPMAGSQAADKPAAVLFHADWCLNCKLMKPRLAALQQQYGDRVEFIRVDYTTDAGRAEGKALAKARGFAKLYGENRATGWVALLKPDGTEAGALHVTMEDAEMQRALEDLLAASESS
ncbi:MAG: thioredoxin domain-containing protein [Abyssibacter sp.]|uniref:TlpA family protein disulfide reductase n=1 Tax=Abyssibacter sp. TaxID=2320200 RepID=UPI002EA605F0|nr:thioredoxin domain-containing protein [Pseudomonadota bacterium]